MSDLRCMRKYGIVLVLCVVLLTGCSKNTSEVTNDYSNHVSPNIVEFEKANGGVSDYYYYSIDKNTGVVYLNYDSYHRHAITVMLNADGTPVTAEQLGIDY